MLELLDEGIWLQADLSPMLLWAAAHGHDTIALRVLELGANPNYAAPIDRAGGCAGPPIQEGEHCWTPLQWADAHGRFHIAHALLEHGAIRLGADTKYAISLENACREGDLERAYKLLSFGATQLPSDAHGIEGTKAALFVAERSPNHHLTWPLVRDVLRSTDTGDAIVASCIEVGLRSDQDTAVPLMIQCVSLELINNHGQRLMDMANALGNDRAIELLRTAGFPAPNKDSRHNTSILAAIREGNLTELARLFKDGGTVRNKAQAASIALGAFNPHGTNAVPLLLDQGVDATLFKSLVSREQFSDIREMVLSEIEHYSARESQSDARGE